MESANRLLRNSAVLLLLVCPLFANKPGAQSLSPIPEPGLILCGRVLDRQTSQPVQTRTVVLQITGNGETVNVASNEVRFASINGQLFYVAQILFETRDLGTQNLGKTPNSLALTTGVRFYTRAATVNGKPAAFKAPGSSQFLFGASERGRVDNLDLEVEDTPPIGPEPGTEPRLQANLKPTLQNGEFAGIVFEWTSAAGKTYSIYRTTDVTIRFEKIGTVKATPPLNQFNDQGAVGSGPFFYQLAVDE